MASIRLHAKGELLASAGVDAKSERLRVRADRVVHGRTDGGTAERPPARTQRGTVLAVPMLVIIRSVADHVEPFKPLGRLIYRPAGERGLLRLGVTPL